jgi:histidinol dehydrogenase
LPLCAAVPLLLPFSLLSQADMEYELSQVILVSTSKKIDAVETEIENQYILQRVPKKLLLIRN